VILTPPASPRKNGVVIPHKDKEHGTLTQANEQDIALFRYKTRVYAVKEECPHAGLKPWLLIK
jgi:nitrite reductase/ring-hydroxylating ferredoxin subunit